MILYRWWMLHRRALLGGIGAAVLLLGSIVWLGGRPARPPVAASPLLVQTPTPLASVWDTATSQARQAEVLAALNCARERTGLAPLVLDPQLSAAAAQGWETLQQDVTVTSAEVLGTYAWSAVVTMESTAATPAACGWAGFDPRADPAVQTLAAVGIAVFPPIGYSGASAVIVGRMP